MSGPGLSSPEPEPELWSAAHRSPAIRLGAARAGWPGQDGVGTTLPAQLSVPGIATIASVATTMARVAADTDLGHVLPFMLLWQSAYNHSQVTKLLLVKHLYYVVIECPGFS